MVEEQNEDTRAVDLLNEDLTDVSPEEIRAAQA
ncbi:nucleotide exchange factor GrpE, partial [Xanthomonas citri pv. citri]|nr:nucleotide exchange factor GrpE [Xanthomonas citri pv. citri]